MYFMNNKLNALIVEKNYGINYKNKIAYNHHYLTNFF